MSNVVRAVVRLPMIRVPGRFRAAVAGGKRPGRDADGRAVRTVGDALDSADEPEDESESQLAAALQQFYDEV